MLWAALDNDQALYNATKQSVLSEYELADGYVGRLANMVESDADRDIAKTLGDNLDKWKVMHAEVRRMILRDQDVRVLVGKPVAPRVGGIPQRLDLE